MVSVCEEAAESGQAAPEQPADGGFTSDDPGRQTGCLLARPG